MANFDAIVKQLQAERDRIDSAIAALQELSNSNPVSSGGPRARKTMSAAARRRIAAAQRARWARVKSQKVVPIKAGTHHISAAGRARIAAAARARWARMRAGKKG
jgi:hypothetical protein